MPLPPDLLTTAEAAAELDLAESTIRYNIKRKAITPVRIDGRTWGIPRAEVERYRTESLGKRGRRKKEPATVPTKE